MGGLGEILFSDLNFSTAVTYRTTTPTELEFLLPSHEEEKVRIAQLEMHAVPLALVVIRNHLENSFTRIHIDNTSAMCAVMNVYSGSPCMACLAAETWALLFEYNIVPYFEYVPSKLNTSDNYSRPDPSA